MDDISHTAHTKEPQEKDKSVHSMQKTHKETHDCDTKMSMSSPLALAHPILVLLIDDSAHWAKAQKHLMAVAAVLSECAQAYEIHIICRKDSPLHHAAQAYSCIPLFPPQDISRLKKNSPAAWRMALKLLWRFGRKVPACVHTFSPSCIALARKFSRWRVKDKKNIAGTRTLMLHSAFGTPKEEGLLPKHARRHGLIAEKILCPSQFVMDAWFESGVVPERIGVVYAAYEPPPELLPASASETTAKLRDEATQITPATIKKRFIFMAFENLEEGAGLTVLLKAMAALWQHPHLPEWEVRVVGSGSLFETLLEEAEALGIAPRLALLGIQPMEPMASTAHVIVCPHTKPIGNIDSLMLAWNYALPLICTQVPGNLEVATVHNALLVPPGDPQSLAAAMIACMSDPQIEQHYSHMSSTMSTQAHMSRLQAEYCKLYETSIAQRHWSVPT